MARHCGKGFISKCVTAAAVALISGMAFAGPGTAPFDSPMYHGSIERDIQSRALWAPQPNAPAPASGAVALPASATAPFDSPTYHGSIERDIQSRALWATPSTGAASVGVARWEPATTTSPLSRQDPDMRGDALYDVGANL